MLTLLSRRFRARLTSEDESPAAHAHSSYVLLSSPETVFRGQLLSFLRRQWGHHINGPGFGLGTELLRNISGVARRSGFPLDADGVVEVSARGIPLGECRRCLLLSRLTKRMRSFEIFKSSSSSLLELFHR